MLCKCEIEQDKDWKGGKSILKTCPAHAHITSAQVLYETCLNESRRAMNVLRKVEQNMPDLYDVTLDREGKQLSRQMKPGVDVQFSYGTSKDDRTLHVKCAGFKGVEKNIVKAFADDLAPVEGAVVVE